MKPKGQNKSRTSLSEQLNPQLKEPKELQDPVLN